MIKGYGQRVKGARLDYHHLKCLITIVVVDLKQN